VIVVLLCSRRKLLSVGDGLVSFLKIDGDTCIHLDREKIRTVGKEAVGDLLNRINIFKVALDVYSVHCP